MAERSSLPATTEAHRHLSRAPKANRAPGLAGQVLPAAADAVHAAATEALPLPQVSEIDAAAVQAPCSGSVFSKKIRRASRKIAGGEQIPTGTNRTKTAKGALKASVIVLVTSFGNVTVRAN